MLSALKKSLPVLLAVGLVPSAQAFSLLGQLEPWQIAEVGYGPEYNADIGGPKNLGEEYRWGMPILTYAFDASFLNYFGQDGVDAVEEAIAILNTLPTASSLSSNLTEREFLGEKRGINHRARALGLIDLRSYALSLLLEEMGVGAPERYAWTLRAHRIINQVDYFSVLQWNFDPVTLRPTPYVNGTLFTYQILQTSANPDWWEAVEVQVDPGAIIFSTVAGFIQSTLALDAFGSTIASALAGVYFTGLTREDIGALRYILHPLNFNVEQLPAGTTGGFGGGGGGGGGGGTGGAWSDPLGGGTAFLESPWGDPFAFLGVIPTNIFIPTNIVTNVVSTVPVDPTLRAGLNKLTFQRVEFDSLVGLSPGFTNRWTDTYITNGVVRRQTLQLGGNVPHIVFMAGDLDVLPDATPFLVDRTANWQDHSALNTSGLGGSTRGGPGTIQPTVAVTFSKIGPAWLNVEETGELDPSTLIWSFWGWFDGTTNDPVVFPQGTSIRELENRVLRRR
jgi:hypothetical protein